MLGAFTCVFLAGCGSEDGASPERAAPGSQTTKDQPLKRDIDLEALGDSPVAGTDCTFRSGNSVIVAVDCRDSGDPPQRHGDIAIVDPKASGITPNPRRACEETPTGLILCSVTSDPAAGKIAFARAYGPDEDSARGLLAGIVSAANKVPGSAPPAARPAIASCPDPREFAEDVPFVDETGPEVFNPDPATTLACSYREAGGFGSINFTVEDLGDPSKAMAKMEQLKTKLAPCPDPASCLDEYSRWEFGDDFVLGANIGKPIGDNPGGRDPMTRSAGYVAAVSAGSHVCSTEVSSMIGTDPEELASFADGILRAMKRACGRTGV